MITKTTNTMRVFKSAASIELIRSSSKGKVSLDEASNSIQTRAAPLAALHTISFSNEAKHCLSMVINFFQIKKTGDKKMKSIKNKIVTLAFGALALFAVSQNSHAASSITLDLHVSINATKSLTATTTTYNYGALSVNVSSVSSAFPISNNSGALIETYTLQGADANSTQSGTTWTLSATTSSVTPDLYALEAQFSTTQPTKNDGDWTTDLLVSSASACSSDGNKFGNGTVGQAGYNVSPAAGSNSRNLFFRLHTPVVVTDTTERLAVVTVAVQ